MIMKTLIEQLRDGEIAVKNDDTEYALERVLRAAFPKDDGSSGIYPFYVKMVGEEYFKGIISCTIPSYSVVQFIKELENQTTKQQMKTITSEQAQSIIDIACTTWKPSLAARWATDIVLKKSIDITEEYYAEMRKACTTEQHTLFDKIFGIEVKYKVGDYVITKGYTKDYDGRVLKITKISNNNCGYFEVFDGGYFYGTPNFGMKMIFRLATPEEIKKATMIPDGTPCFVRGDIHGGWRLRYADGNGRFYQCSKKKSGDTNKWAIVHKYSDGLPED